MLENCEAYLAQGGLDFSAEGVSTSMVYWADVMYAEPEAPDADFESMEEGLSTAETDTESPNQTGVSHHQKVPLWIR